MSDAAEQTIPRPNISEQKKNILLCELSMTAVPWIQTTAFCIEHESESFIGFLPQTNPLLGIIGLCLYSAVVNLTLSLKIRMCNNIVGQTLVEGKPTSSFYSYVISGFVKGAVCKNWHPVAFTLKRAANIAANCSYR